MRPILISKTLWQETWRGLRARGVGDREAACIWGGRRTADNELVERIYFVNDFGPVESHALAHRTPRETSAALFNELRRNEHVIVADVHTHPADWVDLSITDEAHPIEYRPGLIAIVIPHFARMAPQLSTVGVHEYAGEGKWRTLNARQVFKIIQIT